MPDLITGKRFVLTGTMSKQRSSVMRDISVAGGYVEASVTRGTDYVVTPNYGYRRTIKIQRADEYGIPIINETELYQRIRGLSAQQAERVAEEKITQTGGLDLSSFFEE